MSDSDQGAAVNDPRGACAPVDDVEKAVVLSCLAGDRIAAYLAERVKVARRLQAVGRSLNQLAHNLGWNPP